MQLEITGILAPESMLFITLLYFPSSPALINKDSMSAFLTRPEGKGHIDITHCHIP